MIGILNYGCGNVQAFINIFERLNIQACSISRPEGFGDISHAILPGVGAFDWAMNRLNQSGMRDALEKSVQIDRLPVLGVCVGMQMMGGTSEEGVLPGLGWIRADVRKFDNVAPNGTQLRLPHMGWNHVHTGTQSPLFCGLADDSKFYFLHSYYVHVDESEVVMSTTQYGIEFVSGIHRDQIFGVQFHPEKSHSKGIRLLKNFAEI